MFVKRGAGQGNVLQVSFFLPRAQLGLLSPWLSAYVPFLHLEIALHQEESEEKTSNHRTVAPLMEKRGPADAAGGAQVLEGGHTAARTSQQLLTFSRKQGGRKPERSGMRNREGVCRGEPDTPWGTKCNHLPPRNSSCPGLLESILPQWLPSKQSITSMSLISLHSLSLKKKVSF